MVAVVGSRLGMYVQPTYSHACALLRGFELGRNENALWLFTEWLLTRDPDRPELAFESKVLNSALGADERPGISSLAEDEDAHCRQHLSELLAEFLNDRQFASDRRSAGEALNSLVEVTPMADDIAKVVRSHVDSGAYVAALWWFEQLFRDRRPMAHEDRLMQAARAGLRQSHAGR